MERGKNRVERCERVRFQAPKGTKSEPAKIMLQIAQIVPPQAQIVGKISCAFKMTQVDVIQFPRKWCSACETSRRIGWRRAMTDSIS